VTKADHPDDDDQDDHQWNSHYEEERVGLLIYDKL